MVDLHDRLEWVETKLKSVPTQRSTWDRIMSLRKVAILLVLDAVLAVAIGYWAGRSEAPKEPERSPELQIKVEREKTIRDIANQMLKERQRNGM